MRRDSVTVVRWLFFLWTGVAWLVFGCEEVLEVCQPCGSVLNGDITISGDPRIDGTFDAVKRVAILAEEADQSYREDLDALRDALGLPPDAPVADLAEAVRVQLIEYPSVSVHLGMEPARCWIDGAFVLDTEFGCEERSECNVSDGCRERAHALACIGYFVGACGEADAAVASCDPDAGPCAGEVCVGRCFQSSDDRPCDGACIGLCAGASAIACPGRCFGECTGGCSAYDADGLCAGFCDGLCTGSCDGQAAFPCNGRCRGRCGTESEAGQGCAGECRGGCEDPAGRRIAGPEDRCRGYLTPVGCDATCGDCREMAELLAWAAVTCDPAAIRLGVAFSDGFKGDRDAVIQKAQVFENVLMRASGLYARLALLVDGQDWAGALGPGDLDPSLYGENETAAYLEDPDYVQSLGVVADRRYLPLSRLKARLGMLAGTATNGDFMIAAGALACVQPALEQAGALVDQLIPVADADGQLSMARDCPAPADEVLAPCLYRIIDGLGLLIDLAK